MTRKPQPDLHGPEIPADLVYLWRWFLDLNGARQGSGFGPSPISWGELNAYFRLHDIDPAAWELKLLRRLDHLALEVMSPPSK